jgi:hypothetical protein
MIKISIEIEDEVKEFDLPENWNEVSVEQFIKLFSFNRDDLTIIEITSKVISCFTGIDEDLLMLMDYDDFTKIAKQLDFTKDDEGLIEQSEFIVLDNEEYYLKTDFSKYTMGEIISIETILGEANGNIFRVIDKLLCIFLRKKKENGKLETFKGEFMSRVDLFKRAPISKVYNVFSFFLNGGILLDNNIKDYSENPS